MIPYEWTKSIHLSQLSLCSHKSYLFPSVRGDWTHVKYESHDGARKPMYLVSPALERGVRQAGEDTVSRYGRQWLCAKTCLVCVCALSEAPFVRWLEWPPTETGSHSSPCVSWEQCFGIEPLHALESSTLVIHPYDHPPPTFPCSLHVYVSVNRFGCNSNPRTRSTNIGLGFRYGWGGHNSIL